MKLATIQTSNGSKVVAVVEVEGQQRFVDFTQIDSSLPSSLLELLTLENGLQRAASATAEAVSKACFVEGRVTAPIPRPGKVFCIGLNYRDHAAETGKPIPEKPVVFSKFSEVVVGPDDAIRLPRSSQQVDYEAELVVVIGKCGKYIPEEEARNYIAGYMNGHDVSARDWQVNAPGGQWLLAKTADTFAPTGPYLVTTDDVPDPHRLRIQLRLNGRVMQDSNTRELIFSVEQLVSHISQIITLRPGDLIFTGTPPGVGMARKPPVFLQPGDTVEVEIEGLGVLRNPVTAD